MATPSAQDIRTQLDGIDACLRKYVRLRAQLIEVLAFMEDEKEQEHLRLIRERGQQAPAADAEQKPSAAGDGSRAFQGPFRPKPVPPLSEEPRRSNPLATTLSMEA